MADDKGTRPTSIAINYLKSNDFREVTSDGVLGGPTPQGKLWIAFYAERFPLPRVVEHKIIPLERPDEFSVDIEKGTVIEARPGIVRHVEFGVYLTPQSAKQLHEWLGSQIKKMEEREEIK
jgi:hypothetical protein